MRLFLHVPRGNGEQSAKSELTRNVTRIAVSETLNYLYSVDDLQKAKRKRIYIGGALFACFRGIEAAMADMEPKTWVTRRSALGISNSKSAVRGRNLLQAEQEKLLSSEPFQRRREATADPSTALIAFAIDFAPHDTVLS